MVVYSCMILPPANSVNVKTKVFVHLFQKVVGFKRAKPFDALRRVRKPSRQALIGRAREPFCKRKGSRKPIVSREQPQKLSGGWFLTLETCSDLRGAQCCAHALTCDRSFERKSSFPLGNSALAPQHRNGILPQTIFIDIIDIIFVGCHRGVAPVPPRAFCKKLDPKLLFSLFLRPPVQPNRYCDRWKFQSSLCGDCSWWQALF